MSSLNRRNDEMSHLMKARTDKRNISRPKALTGKKRFYFERLEELRIENNKWYPFLLKKYLKRLVNN